MNKYELNRGAGRTRVSLLAYYLGNDPIVFIYNENAHIGAIALGEYDHKELRASTSVLTRLGHKDDAIAQMAAHSISKHTKKPACVICGIHLDNITDEEIQEILNNCTNLIEEAKLHL